ncbi:MAG: MarC family protein [Planctomycetota bacterium]
MTELLAGLLPFLAILNPFALCLYLIHVMEELRPGQFALVLGKASVASLAVFCVFAVAGEPLLVKVLRIRPGAMRVFGGIVFFVVAYGYVTKGYKATTLLRGRLDELPSEIAVPFMIGAGTITQATLLGKQHSAGFAVLVLVVGMVVSVLAVLLFNYVRMRMKGVREDLFERYINILSRLNGLLIGALSADMVVTGIHELWEAA